MCTCLTTKLQELTAELEAESSSTVLQSLWVDESLNPSKSGGAGVAVRSLYMTKSSTLAKELKEEKFFLPISFCPFCGEKLSSLEDSPEVKEKKLQDQEAFALFTKLEDDLEEKFDNITVKDLNEAYEIAYSLLEEVNLEFTLTKFNEENRMEILYKGHFDNHSIELFLEADEDMENIYTVAVF
jgi:hypothetical protein